jgi:hypothetical protein
VIRYCSVVLSLACVFVLACATEDSSPTAPTVNAPMYDAPLYTVSGSVTFDGSERIYINLLDAATRHPSWSGTSIMAGEDFTIRGVAPGNYLVVAYADDMGFGRRRVHSLAAESLPVQVDGDVTGVALELEQVIEMVPTSPPKMSAHPVESGVALYWHGMGFRGMEVADTYNVYWSSSPDVSPTNHEGVRRGVPAQGVCSNMWQLGLENGKAYYWIVTSQVGDVEAKPSAVAGPVTIGPATAGATLTGTLTFEGGAPKAAVWLGALTDDDFESYFTYFTDPKDVQEYSIPGLPDGDHELEMMIAVDIDGDGAPSGADYILEVAIQVSVQGDAVITRDLVVTDAALDNGVRTTRWVDEAGLMSGVAEVALVQATRLPVAVSTPTVGGQVDVGGVERAELNGRAFVYTAPIADSYEADVTWVDGTTDRVVVSPASTDFPELPALASATATEVQRVDATGTTFRVGIYEAGAAFVPFASSTESIQGLVQLTDWTDGLSVSLSDTLAAGDYVVAIEVRGPTDNRSVLLSPLSL